MTTPLSEDRILSLIDPNQVHPREAKATLGKIIVEQYHSQGDAEKAADDFRKRFSEHQVLADTEVKTIAAELLQDGKIGILTLLKEVGFVPSTNQAKQLVEGARYI